jgi:hypothetical protein
MKNTEMVFVKELKFGAHALRVLPKGMRGCNLTEFIWVQRPKPYQVYAWFSCKAPRKSCKDNQKAELAT